MNKITSCMTVVAALAVGSAFAELTPFDKLELAEAVTFSGAPTGELTGDLTGAAAYTLAQTGSDILKDVEKFTIKLKVGFVDSTELATLKPQGAKIGFAFTGTSTAAYFNGNAWTPVVVDTVTEGADKTLLIELDRRVTTEGKVKARFKLDSTAVTEWVAVADVETNSVAIYGSGTVVSVNGATYTIETSAEVIVIHPENGKNVTFNETQIATMASQLGGATPAPPAQVAEALKATTKQDNGLTALDNFVLFGKVTGATAADVPVVKGNPTGGDADNVAISIPNLKLQTVTGATVSFQLRGRAAGETATWHDVGEANETGEFTFSANTTDRYFKVVTTITYGTPVTVE